VMRHERLYVEVAAAFIGHKNCIVDVDVVTENLLRLRALSLFLSTALATTLPLRSTMPTTGIFESAASGFRVTATLREIALTGPAGPGIRFVHLADAA